MVNELSSRVAMGGASGPVGMLAVNADGSSDQRARCRLHLTTVHSNDMPIK